MIKVEQKDRVTECEIEGTPKDLVCEAVGVINAVYKTVDGMNKYILIQLIKDMVEEWQNGREI